ncbi:hypothetical protein [Rubritalea tangerina]
MPQRFQRWVLMLWFGPKVVACGSTLGWEREVHWTLLARRVGELNECVKC